jgi:hypothetical protein
MLRPSSFDKVEKRQREESRLQAQEYSLSVFIFFLSRLSYYEEGCNMMLLTTPKCSKPREIPRVSKGNQIPIVCWKAQLIRPVYPVLEKVWSTGLVRPFYRLPEPFTRLVQSWTRLVWQTTWLLEFEFYPNLSGDLTGLVRGLTQITKIEDFL